MEDKKTINLGIVRDTLIVGGLIFTAYTSYVTSKENRRLVEVNTSLQEQVSEMNGRSEKSFKQLETKILGDYKTLLKDKIGIQLEKELKKVTNTLEGQIAESNKIFKKKALQDETESAEAYASAERAILEENFLRARLLLINSFNKSPQNLKPLRELLKLQEKRFSTDDAKFMEVLNLCELAVYQVKPTDLTQCLQMRSKANKLYRQSLEANKEETVNPAALYAELQKESPLNSICLDAKKLEEKINSLSVIQSSITGASKKAVSSELEKAILSLRALSSIESMESVLSEIAKPTRLDADKIEVFAMVASNNLPSLVTYEVMDLPVALLQKIKGIRKRTKEALKDIQKSKANQAVAEFNKKLHSLKKLKKGVGKIIKHQDILEAVEKDAQELRALVVDMTKEKRVEAGKVLTAFIKRNRKAQYQAYQQWANGVMKRLFTRHERTKVFTDADAKKFLKSSFFKTIDKRLLSSVNSETYDHVWNLFKGEGGAQHKMDMLEILNRAGKYKLENF